MDKDKIMVNKCEYCGKPKGKSKKYCSRSCYYKAMSLRKNEKTPRWKGDSVGVRAIHEWLMREYGTENKCENPNCEGKSNTYEWCKLPNKQHERKRENYIRLCRSCHRKLDKIYPPSRKGIRLSNAQIEQRRRHARLRGRDEYGRFNNESIARRGI